MFTRRVSRLALLCVALISHSAGGGVVQAQSSAPAAAGLVVHEWGTFTSVAGRDGEALMWRPLSFESDLPSFVHSIDDGASWEGRLGYPSKSGRSVTVRMETPLLYFYAAEETTVSVKVGFNGGTITEWYPQARSSGGEIDWGRFQVLPGAPVDLPRERGENHYYPARDTDAAMCACAAARRPSTRSFFSTAASATSRCPSPSASKGTRCWCGPRGRGESARSSSSRKGAAAPVTSSATRSGEETRLERPALAGDAAAVRRELKSLLMSQGLYEREAEAMLNTWRDSWFEEGLRVFYVLPRQTVDAILPVTIEPRPTELAACWWGARS